MSIGENIGWEQDGKGGLFARPVLVIKGFSPNTILGAPLTTKSRASKYYYDLGTFKNNVRSWVVLSQLRTLDVSRISGRGRPMHKLTPKELSVVRKTINQLLNS